MGNKPDICHDDKTTYVGETKKHKFHGAGTLYYNETGNLYKGEFKNGQKDGFGEMCYYNGDKYIGEFYHDELHGKGKYISNNGYVYEGVFTVGSLLGKGNMYDADGNLIYEGDFLNNLPHGFGISYYNGKILYVGKWNQNLYHGHGLLIDNNTNKYGLFQEGMLVEQITKIPTKLYRYINGTNLYDSNINLTKHINSGQNPTSKNVPNLKPQFFTQIHPVNLHQTSQLADSRIIENPFNRILFNPIISSSSRANINYSSDTDKNLSKSFFTPTNIR